MFASSTSQTWARIEPHLARFGITRIGDRSAYERHRQLHVACAIRPDARSFGTSHGHGATALDAKVAAAMAAIERAVAERPAIDVRIARAADLDGEVIDPSLWPARMTVRYTPERSLAWARARTIGGGRTETWVPYELVHADETSTEDRGVFRPSTTGLAAGPTVEEATFAALLEVIERDAASLWAFRDAAGMNACRVRFDGVAPSRIEALVRDGVDVQIWDLTAAAGVPVIRASLGAGDGSWIGVAARPSRDDALDAAVCEAIAARAEHDAGGPWSISRRRIRVLDARRTQIARDSAPGEGGRPWSAVGSISGDAAAIAGRLRSEGHDPVVVVLASEPVAVVRVLAPGLEYPREGNDYAPGPRARAIQEAAR